MWLLSFVPAKGAITWSVGAIMHWPAQVRARASVILANGGEFGLLLLTQAMPAGAIVSEVGEPALVALAMTMALGPILEAQCQNRRRRQSGRPPFRASCGGR